MKKTVQKIRQQPFHIRETVVLVSAFVVFALVGIIWFTDFQADTYALLNPQEVQEGEDTAVAADERTSPFASLLSSIGDLKAQISDFISQTKEDIEEQRERTPQNLPISE
jgi:hypothetical protein